MKNNPKHLFIYACVATLCLAAFSSVSYRQSRRIVILETAGRQATRDAQLWQKAALQYQTNAMMWRQLATKKVK